MAATMKSAQTLASTTASLLYSAGPFMLMSLLATVISALALVISEEPLQASRVLCVGVIMLALPAAWLSMRVLLDARIMTQWAQHDGEPAFKAFDESLLALGLIKSMPERDLIDRARGCLRVQKRLILLAVGQWLLCVTALVCEALI